MADYIEREALMQFPIRIDHYDKKHGNEHFVLGIESVLEYAESLPAADVVEVVHGKWIEDILSEAVTCSLCRYTDCTFNYNRNEWGSNYCPNCGAKMDGKGEGEC